MATKKTGITLAAEGEKEFRKAINDINRDMSAMRSEMTIVTSEFAGNEKSMEALTAKGKVLRDTYDMQSEKLEVMREALAKIKSGYGENSDKAKDWETKLKKQEAALAKTKAEIIKNNTAMEEAAKAEREMSDGLDDISESAKKAGEATIDMSDIIKSELISSAIQSGIGSLKDSFFELAGSAQQASNIFQVSTGATVESMGQYEEAIKSIYKNNFGESLQDVAVKMSKVKEITGEIDASALQNLTESAITLEDTFGMDMVETLRGSKALMEHFGLSSEKAFDLIASGAQQGLNYTDELGDNVSEYSGKFAEAGYSASEYFQLLKNGAAGGAYNLDKVNDAINEVTTRIADGTIEDSMDMFSKNTKKVFNQWQNGQASQKQVIEQIVEDIKNCTNEQEKMNIAAKAFGTMAEDGGMQFIQSLNSVGQSFDDVNGKMEDVKQVRYDDVMNEIEGLGRTIKIDVIAPLIEEFMPEIKGGLEFIIENVGWLIEHKDVLISGIAAIGAGFVTWKVATMISGVVSAIKAFQLANEGATVAQALLNGVMMANPMVLIATLIAALVAGLAVFILKNENAREKVGQAWDWIKEKVAVAVDWVKEKFDLIVNFFKDNWQGILLFLMNPFAGAFKLLYDNCDAFRNFIDKWLGKIGDKFDDALDFLRDLPGNALQWGKDFIDGFVDGISNGIDKVEKAASKVAGKVRSFLHFSVPDEGPLADADEYGSDFVDLYAGGITDNINKIEQAASQMSLGIKNNMNPEMKNITRGDTIISSSMKDMQLVANIEVGGKKVANVMTPLIIKQMNRENRNKEVVSGI